MKAAGYIRVSRTDQNPDMQREAIKRHADSRGWPLLGFYEDKGVCGIKGKREGLDDLMDDAHRRRFKVVIVWKFDRFARSTRHLLDALYEFRDLGIDFVSITEGIDTSTHMGRMVFTFLAAVAEFERELIRERVKAGVATAREKRGGQWGRRPKVFHRDRVLELREKGLGWRRIGTVLEIAPETARRVWNARKGV